MSFFFGFKTRFVLSMFLWRKRARFCKKKEDDDDDDGDATEGERGREHGVTRRDAA